MLPVFVPTSGANSEDSGKRTPLDVSQGDTVLYSKYGGTEIKVDGEDLLVLRESDVLAKAIPAKARGKRELAGVTA